MEKMPVGGSNDEKTPKPKKSGSWRNAVRGIMAAVAIGSANPSMAEDAKPALSEGTKISGYAGTEGIKSTEVKEKEIVTLEDALGKIREDTSLSPEQFESLKGNTDNIDDFLKDFPDNKLEVIGGKIFFVTPLAKAELDPQRIADMAKAIQKGKEEEIQIEINIKLAEQNDGKIELGDDNPMTGERRREYSLKDLKTQLGGVRKGALKEVSHFAFENRSKR